MGSLMRIVIIGNGVAGVEAALAVRGREPDWDITLISEESDHFFSRTALMWVFSGQMSQRDIEPLERDAYTRLGFRRLRLRETCSVQCGGFDHVFSTRSIRTFDEGGSASRGQTASDN